MSLVNIATGALLAKDLFGSKSRSRSSGTKKGGSKGIGTFGKIILAVGGAYVANKLIESYSKDNLTDQIGLPTDSNGNTNNAATLAFELYGAFHPYLDWASWLPDGTDEAAVLKIAAKIKAANNYAAVASAYKTLYGNVLVDDLRSEGVYEDFIKVLNGTTTPPQPTNTGGVPPTTTPSGMKQLTKGSIINSYGGYTVRDLSKAGNKVRNTIQGEQWVINSWKEETIAGTFGIWVMVSKGISTSQIQTTYYKIFIKGLYYPKK